MEAAHPIYVDDMTEAFLWCRAALGGRGAARINPVVGREPVLPPFLRNLVGGSGH
jgi:hypothetical protein